MNPELYTEEFRAFKYLKSTPEQVSHYRSSWITTNKIQPWDSDPDADFVWPHRLEFLEQLLDLRNDTVYIVFAGIMSKNNNWEHSNLIRLDKPLIVDRNPIIYDNFKDATTEDIYYIEESPSQYCLISGNSFIPKSNRIFDASGDNRVFRMNSFPGITGIGNDFTEMFYNEETARKYGKALTDFIRKSADAISTFSNAF